MTRSQTTDFPSVYTSYSFEGSTKTIRHYLADDCPVPPILVRIENEIQRLVRIEQWIGTEKEREMLFLTKR